jgi:type IV pilus assembly protein PilA
LAANEASAVGSLRTVTTSNITYFSTYGNGFGSTLGVLGGAAGTTVATCDAALLIDSVLSKNGAGGVVTKAGYTFTYTAGAANATKPTGCTAAGSATWSLTAVPQVVGSTGQRGFFVDGSAVITFTTDGSAPTNASTPL